MASVSPVLRISKIPENNREHQTGKAIHQTYGLYEEDYFTYGFCGYHLRPYLFANQCGLPGLVEPTSLRY